MSNIEFCLSYKGNDADEHELDFYDAAEALIGFQRSLALTTHLVLNGEIIVQAPALKGARIMVRPPEAGSWKVTATIIIGLYYATTASKDTVLGNIVNSTYDYLISESLGFHVDYSKTLGIQYEEHHKQKQRIQKDGTSFIVPSESQMDSLAEKCETAVKQMHRPIIGKKTALNARINYLSSTAKERSPLLTRDTYAYIKSSIETKDPMEYIGRISSYNSNTFKGRIYVPIEQRPVPFELDESIRDPNSIYTLTQSLSENALNRLSESGYVVFTAYRVESQTGLLKKFYIIEVRKATPRDITAIMLGEL